MWLQTSALTRSLRRVIRSQVTLICGGLIILQGWHSRPENRFDMVYGHYAVMGGFAVDVENMHNVATRVTITHSGVLSLAKNGHFCRVNRSRIQDKSKADILAKGLVCIQVLWVAGQVIERKVAGYPITLLEVHTLVHVVCALVMYGLWAQKPLNVQDPTMLTVGDAPGTFAFMLETSQHHFTKTYRGFEYPYSDGELRIKAAKEECPMALVNEVESQCVNVGETPQTLPRILPVAVIQDGEHVLVHISTYYYLSSRDKEGIEHHHPMGMPLYEYKPASKDPVVCTVYSGQVLSFPDQGLSSKIGLQLPMFSKNSHQSKGISSNISAFTYQDKSVGSSNWINVASLTKKDLRRLSLVSEWISKLEARGVTVRDMSFHHKENPQISLERIASLERIHESEPALRITVANWTTEGLWQDATPERMRFISVLCLLPTAYGCVHLGTLDFIFPTSIERLFWIISCIILIAGGAGMGVYWFIRYMDTSVVSDY